MTTTTQDLQKQQTVEGKAQRLENRPVYRPATDIYETADAIILKMDMPGANEQSVDIHLENDVLTVTGQTDSVTSDAFDVLYSDYEPGNFRRAFTLSEDINRDAIKAAMKHGVLQVTLPKQEKAKPKKIEIQS